MVYFGFCNYFLSPSSVRYIIKGIIDDTAENQPTTRMSPSHRAYAVPPATTGIILYVHGDMTTLSSVHFTLFDISSPSSCTVLIKLTFCLSEPHISITPLISLEDKK